MVFRAGQIGPALAADADGDALAEGLAQGFVALVPNLVLELRASQHDLKMHPTPRLHCHCHDFVLVLAPCVWPTDVADLCMRACVCAGWNAVSSRHLGSSTKMDALAAGNIGAVSLE